MGHEIERLRIDLDISCSSNSNDGIGLTFADLRSTSTRRAILLGVLLMAMTQFCGSFAIINYSATIFALAGSTLHPNVSAMVVAALQVLSTVTFASLVGRVGRKVLLIASAVATSLAWLILGGYFWAQYIGVDVSDCGLLPVTSMSLGMFVVIGVANLPYVLVVELLPLHVS